MDDINTEAQSFFKMLPKAFLYPFRKGGVITFILSLGLIVIAYFAQFSLILGGFISLMVIAYLWSYFMKILRSTGEQESELPDFPEFSQFKREILDPCCGFFIVLAGCTGIPAALISFAEDWPLLGTIGTIWLIAGLIVFPMTLMRVAIMESIHGINPVGVLKTIFKVPFQYFALILISLILFGIGPALGSAFLGVWNFTLVLFLGVCTLYSSFVFMHILGLFYLANEEAFGWDE